MTHITSKTRIALELSLYSTVLPVLQWQKPYSLSNSVPVPSLSRAALALYPSSSDSNSSLMVPIADFPGVGHPRRLRPIHVTKRYLADAEWESAKGPDLQLSKYKAGIRDLEKKKYVYKWVTNRTEEERKEEDRTGLRRNYPIYEPIKATT